MGIGSESAGPSVTGTNRREESMSVMSRIDAVAARMNPWLLLFAIGLTATDLSVAACRLSTPLALTQVSDVASEPLGLLQ